ncbi:MAG: hypothetical protein IPK85_08915 [Gemmatimonadetes bacterium]|nr:hypothetical protein [Gemmatimonadota bacterium]
MLRRSRHFRWFATISSLWLTLVAAVAPSATTCPMGHAAKADRTAPVGQHQEHAGHGVPADSGAPLDPCDCANWCGNAPTTDALVAPVPPQQPSPARVPVMTQRAVVAHAVTRPHLLPFAQGPPA